MLIAEVPELGYLSGEQAAALTGLAPIAHDSDALRGKRAIGAGRRLLRHVLFQAALVASHHNPVLKPLADRLQAAGKPHKVVIIAVARKLVTIANAMCKSRQKWTHLSASNIQLLSSFPNAEWLLADRGYDADWFREAALERGTRPGIPNRKTRKKVVR